MLLWKIQKQTWRCMCQAWVMTEKKPSPLRAWLLDLKTKEVLVMRCEASWPKYNVSGTKNSHIHIYVYTSGGHASQSPDSPALICHPKSDSLFTHTKKLGSTSFKSIFNDHFLGCFFLHFHRLSGLCMTDTGCVGSKPWTKAHKTTRMIFF